MRKDSYRQYPITWFRSTAFVAFLVFSSTSIGYAVDETSVYPGKLGIARGKNLSAAERAVEARFAEYLEKLKAEAVIRVSAEAVRYYTAPAAAQKEEKEKS